MKKVAIFDFDDTLIIGDSLFPFMAFSAGTLPLYAALSASAGAYAFRRVAGKPDADLRTFLKSSFLRYFMKGKTPADIADIVAKTLAWRKLNEPIVRELRKHRENGDVVVIASGSLSLYLPTLLRDIPHDVLLCTDVGVKEGVITGDMPNGNCVRRRKAERVKAWLDANGPFADSFGYGNPPDDLPMLDLVNHKTLI